MMISYFFAFLVEVRYHGRLALALFLGYLWLAVQSVVFNTDFYQVRVHFGQMRLVG